MSRKSTIIALFGALLLLSADVQAGGKHDPVGTWLITVTVPAGQGDLPAPEPFQQLLSFHKNGTVIETNNTLHANSAEPGEALNYNGSNGQGVWDKGPKKTTRYRILKMLYDGISNDFLGYMVLEGSAKIEGDVFTQSADESDIVLIFGPDPDDPSAPRAHFGGADAVGSRLPLD
jgi:hypothetical protein